MSWFSQYYKTVTGNNISDVIPTISRGEGSSLFDIGVKVSPTEETQEQVEKITSVMTNYKPVILIALVAGVILLYKR